MYYKFSFEVCSLIKVYIIHKNLQTNNNNNNNDDNNNSTI